MQADCPFLSNKFISKLILNCWVTCLRNTESEILGQSSRATSLLES